MTCDEVFLLDNVAEMRQRELDAIREAIAERDAEIRESAAVKWAAVLADDLRAQVFSMIESDVHFDGFDAGRIAAAVEHAMIAAVRQQDAE